MNKRLEPSEVISLGRDVVPRRAGRIVAVLVATVVGLGSVAACGSSGGSGSGASTTPVNFAEAGAIDAGTVFGALEKGYFLTNHIKANVKLYPTGVEIINQVAAGGAEFGTLGASVALTAVSKGLPIQIVAINHGDATATSYNDNQAIVAGPNSGIKAGDVAALKGKKIGIPVGTSPQGYLDSILTQNGLKPSDVQVQNIQPADMISALKQGSIDAFVTFEPVPTNATSQIPGAVVVTEGGATHWYDPGVVIANTKWAAAHSDATTQVLAAMAQAAQIGRKDPNAIATIDTHWITGMSVATAGAAIKHVKFDPRLSQNVLTGLKKYTVPFIVKYSGVKASFDPTTAIDGKYLAAAEASHPQFFADLAPLPANQLLK